MKRTRSFPAAVDGEAVVEGEERLPVAEGGPLAQAPQLVGQVAEVAGQVRVAAVDLGRNSIDLFRPRICIRTCLKS